MKKKISFTTCLGPVCCACIRNANRSSPNQPELDNFLRRLPVFACRDLISSICLSLLAAFGRAGLLEWDRLTCHRHALGGTPESNEWPGVRHTDLGEASVAFAWRAASIRKNDG